MIGTSKTAWKTADSANSDNFEATALLSTKSLRSGTHAYEGPPSLSKHTNAEQDPDGAEPWEAFPKPLEGLGHLTGFPYIARRFSYVRPLFCDLLRSSCSRPGSSPVLEFL